MEKLAPAVFAVDGNYHIMFYTDTPELVRVCVGDECYYDESNGVLCSASPVHKVIVPAEELDAAGEYTVYERPIIERKPYFTETAPEEARSYKFRPVPKSGKVRAYHISDAHNKSETPVIAAKVFGDIDFLVLNGDIPDHSGAIENCITVYKIAAGVTGGEIPVVFSRGNHDTRGVLAEKFATLTPTDNGNSFYTFRIGSIWGVVLDCGEDKDDGHEEYGFTVCCHAFRKRQTAFLKRVIERGEYLDPEIKHRIVVVHNPFTHQLSAPFNIEKDIYSEWARLLGEHIKPDVMMAGHLHKLSVNKCGSDFDHLGQPCTVVVGGNVDHKSGFWEGAGYDFEDGEIFVTFTDSDGHKGERIKV